MNDWDDQTQYEPVAKTVYGLLEGQWKRLRRASSTVEMAGYSDQGVQSFRLERRNAIQLLNDWFGPDEAADFEKLPSVLLAMHPSILSSNRDYRQCAKDEVENHAAFLFALMEVVKYRPLNLNGTRIKKAHELILRALLDDSDKPNANKSMERLIEDGMVMEELFYHLGELKTRGLLREVGLDYVVTPAGLKELRRMENEAPETLEQKRFRVLKTLYDLAPDDKHGMVVVEVLARALGMQYHEANRILLYWEEKGMVHSPSGEAVALTAPAIDELEEKINHPTNATQHFPSSINYVDNSVNISGDVQGNVIGGQNNTYSITNESVAAILPQLAEFIGEIKKADFEYRDEVIGDLQRVYELSQQPVSPRIWELIQAKFFSAETAMKVAGFAYKTHQYWPAITEFFHQHWR